MSTASLKSGGETEWQLQERRAELLQQQLQKKEEEKDEQIKARPKSWATVADDHTLPA